MTAKQFQDRITTQIASKLNNIQVKSEWIAFQKIPYQYSPRVDIAVGPFSTTPGENLIAEYNQLLSNKSINDFLRKI